MASIDALLDTEAGDATGRSFLFHVLDCYKFHLIFISYILWEESSVPDARTARELRSQLHLLTLNILILPDMYAERPCIQGCPVPFK